jgi:zinc protease
MIVCLSGAVDSPLITTSEVTLRSPDSEMKDQSMNIRRSMARATLALALAASLLPATPLFAQETQAPPRTLTQPQQPDLGAIPADPEKARTAAPDAPMPLDPSITVGRLDNGLHYWIRENAYPANRAELRLVVKVGSVQESEDQLGIAHFVEHMAFNGTENYPKMDLVRALESFGMRFGADVNASTGFDETMYFLRIPTDTPKIMDSAFQILEDWAHNVTFEDVEVEKERGVVIEEWRLGLGAGSRLRDIQFPVLFADSLYAERLPIGKVEVLEEFDPQRARDFYADWYRPDLMAVIAVGDFDGAEIEARIKEHFGRLQMPAQPPERLYEQVPDHESTRFSIDTDPEATTSTVVVYHKLPLRPQAFHGSYRQSIVEGLYSNMLNRRLSELSQQPNPPFLGASSSQGIFIPSSEVYFIGAAARDGEIPRALEAVYTEVERIDRFGFTESELQREKTQLMRAFERIYTEKNVQDSGTFAEEFTRAFLEGESTPGIDYEWELYQRFLPEITIDEVNAIGQDWVSDHNRVVLVSMPERAGLQKPTEQELYAAHDNAKNAMLRPYRDTVTEAPLLNFDPTPGSVVEETRIEELGVTEWTLSNGIRVVMKPTTFRGDQVLFRAFSPGGTSLASDADLVAAQTAVQVVAGSGFGPFSARQLTNLLADKVVNVRPYIGQRYEGLLGTASPRDLETLFQLSFVTATEPRADSGVFGLIQDQIRAGLANREVSPEAAWSERLQQIMSQEHPRRRPVSVAMVDEMDLVKSYDFYLDRFADLGDAVFVFVGNFDTEAMRPLVEKYLGSLPTNGREETWADEGVRLPRGAIREDVNRGREPKSITALVFTGDLELEEAERRSAGAMAEVLQTRLREVMREDLSGTYGVSVDASLYEEPASEYSVSISFGSDPDRVDELVDVVFQEVEKLRSAPPTDQELASVRESFRRVHELDVSENGYWLQALVNAYQEGDDPLEILEYDERLAQVTPEHVQRAAMGTLDASSVVRVSLFPEDHESR